MYHLISNDNNLLVADRVKDGFNFFWILNRHRHWVRWCQAVQLERENYHYGGDLDEDGFDEDDLDEDDFDEGDLDEDDLDVDGFDDVFVCVLCFSFSCVFVCWNPEGIPDNCRRRGRRRQCKFFWQV